MSTSPEHRSENGLGRFPVNPMTQALDYWIDACQRTILFWDVLRKRGNMYLEHEEKGKPPILTFPYEMVMDGRKLERPCNYFLVRIVPEADATIDASKRPFVVVDPRAGHGPGIGGSKADSQIGVATRAGHPCYFIGFHPDPVPGQTLGDVAAAEATFLEKISSLHPQVEGKPCVIGNCQAGWAVAALSAARPDLVGPVMLAGAPLSYWGGVRGKNPMRYTGGLVGGSWPALLISDLGNGRFDGAMLVQNFENLNPANTLWSKQYNLYSKIDTEESRYLGFEKWWGGHFLMNREEMKQIVDQLFVGNKLQTGEIVTAEGRRLDLRNIKSPILVFASFGDDITPPQQALNWIVDLYETVDQIRVRGQTIIYLLHHDIGHLGIFVSGKIAKKEHAQFVQTLDLIDMLPPGLYEMIIEDKKPGDAAADLVAGDYLVRFEARTIADIKALDDDVAEDYRFAAVSRLSEINEGVYETFVSPLVRSLSSESSAELLRRSSASRSQYYALSDQNPLMAGVETLANWVRENRRPADPSNPFLAVQKTISDQIVQGLNGYRDARDRMCEATFESTYDSPLLQACLGLRSSAAGGARRRVRDEAFEALVQTKISMLKARIDVGGKTEAFARILAYLVYHERDKAYVDARGFRWLQRWREERGAARHLSDAEFKALFREQAFMVMLDQAAALAALPKLLPTEEERSEVMTVLRRLAGELGELGAKREPQLREIEALLGGSASLTGTQEIGAAVGTLRAIS